MAQVSISVCGSIEMDLATKINLPSKVYGTPNNVKLNYEVKIENGLTEMSDYGCSWSYATNNCKHGDSCSFTNKILDLDNQSSAFSHKMKAQPLKEGKRGKLLPKVLILRTTSRGLLKVPLKHPLHKMIQNLPREKPQISNNVPTPNILPVGTPTIEISVPVIEILPNTSNPSVIVENVESHKYQEINQSPLQAEFVMIFLDFS